MKKLNDGKLIFEQKCRKCGRVTEMYHSDRASVNYFDFAGHMQDKVVHPRLEECAVCGRSTVHDIISYSGPFIT